MKPIDYRNETWDQLRDRVEGLREQVWRGMIADGRAHTTRAWAIELDIDLLTIRPRITELCELGFVELEEQDWGGAPHTREGWYRACSEFQARRHFEAKALAAKTTQLELVF